MLTSIDTWWRLDHWVYTLNFSVGGDYIGVLWHGDRPEFDTEEEALLAAFDCRKAITGVALLKIITVHGGWEWELDMGNIGLSQTDDTPCCIIDGVREIAMKWAERLGLGVTSP